MTYQSSRTHRAQDMMDVSDVDDVRHQLQHDGRLGMPLHRDLVQNLDHLCSHGFLHMRMGVCTVVCVDILVIVPY